MSVLNVPTCSTQECLCSDSSDKKDGRTRGARFVSFCFPSLSNLCETTVHNKAELSLLVGITWSHADMKLTAPALTLNTSSIYCTTPKSQEALHVSFPEHQSIRQEKVMLRTQYLEARRPKIWNLEKPRKKLLQWKMSKEEKSIKALLCKVIENRKTNVYSTWNISTPWMLFVEHVLCRLFHVLLNCNVVMQYLKM